MKNQIQNSMGNTRLVRAFYILVVLGMGFSMINCSPDGNEPEVALIQDMMEQPAIKAQDFQPHDRDKTAMRVPPKGSWPKNRPPFLYADDPVEAGEKLQNPFKGNTEVTQLGQVHFNNFCMVCHGEGGKGDGPVAPKWKPIVVPSLMTDKIRDYPDGRIFHIITMGQGLMGTYIHQLPSEKDRWAVINYVRQLQEQTPRGN